MIDFVAIYYRPDREIAMINDSYYDSQWKNNGNNLTRKEVFYKDFPGLCDDLISTAGKVDDNGLQKYYLNNVGNIMERENWVEAEETNG